MNIVKTYLDTYLFPKYNLNLQEIQYIKAYIQTPQHYYYHNKFSLSKISSNDVEYIDLARKYYQDKDGYFALLLRAFLLEHDKKNQLLKKVNKISTKSNILIGKYKQQIANLQNQIATTPSIPSPVISNTQYDQIMLQLDAILQEKNDIDKYIKKIATKYNVYNQNKTASQLLNDIRKYLNTNDKNIQDLKNKFDTNEAILNEIYAFFKTKDINELFIISQKYKISEKLRKHYINQFGLDKGLNLRQVFKHMNDIIEKIKNLTGINIDNINNIKKLKEDSIMLAKIGAIFSGYQKLSTKTVLENVEGMMDYFAELVIEINKIIKDFNINDNNNIKDNLIAIYNKLKTDKNIYDDLQNKIEKVKNQVDIIATKYKINNKDTLSAINDSIAYITIQYDSIIAKLEKKDQDKLERIKKLLEKNKSIKKDSNIKITKLTTLLNDKKELEVIINKLYKKIDNNGLIVNSIDQVNEIFNIYNDKIELIGNITNTIQNIINKYNLDDKGDILLNIKNFGKIFGKINYQTKNLITKNYKTIKPGTMLENFNIIIKKFQDLKNMNKDHEYNEKIYENVIDNLTQYQIFYNELEIYISTILQNAGLSDAQNTFENNLNMVGKIIREYSKVADLINEFANKMDIDTNLEVVDIITELIKKFGKDIMQNKKNIDDIRSLVKSYSPNFNFDDNNSLKSINSYILDVIFQINQLSNEFGINITDPLDLNKISSIYDTELKNLLNNNGIVSGDFKTNVNTVRNFLNDVSVLHNDLKLNNSGDKIKDIRDYIEKLEKNYDNLKKIKSNIFIDNVGLRKEKQDLQNELTQCKKKKNEIKKKYNDKLMDLTLIYTNFANKYGLSHNNLEDVIIQMDTFIANISKASELNLPTNLNDIVDHLQNILVNYSSNASEYANLINILNQVPTFINGGKPDILAIGQYIYDYDKLKESVDTVFKTHKINSMSDLNDMINTLKINANNDQQKLQELTQKIAQYESNLLNDNHLAQIQTLTDDNNQYKINIDDLNAKYQAQLKVLQDDKAAHLVQIDNLNDQYQAQLKKLQDDNASQLAQIKTFTDDSGQYKIQIDNLNKQYKTDSDLSYAQYQAHLKTLQDNNDTHLAQIRKLTDDSNQYIIKIAELEAINKECNNKIEQLKKETNECVDIYAKDINELKNRINKYESDYEQIKQELETCKKELGVCQSISSSSSSSGPSSLILDQVQIDKIEQVNKGSDLIKICSYNLNNTDKIDNLRAYLGSYLMANNDIILLQNCASSIEDIKKEVTYYNTNNSANYVCVYDHTKNNRLAIILNNALYTLFKEKKYIINGLITTQTIYITNKETKNKYIIKNIIKNIIKEEKEDLQSVDINDDKQHPIIAGGTLYNITINNLTTHDNYIETCCTVTGKKSVASRFAYDKIYVSNELVIKKANVLEPKYNNLSINAFVKLINFPSGFNCEAIIRDNVNKSLKISENFPITATIGNNITI